MRFDDLCEYLDPSPGRFYWHGTTATAARAIAAEGFLKPAEPSRAHLAPVKGHVYLHTDFHAAVGEAQFRSMRDPDKMAGLVRVRAEDLGKEYSPDEDDLADAMETYSLYADRPKSEIGKFNTANSNAKALYDVGRDVYDLLITSPKLRARWVKINSTGYFSQWCSLAKTLLPKIKSDFPILYKRLVAISTRMAHQGEVKVDKVFVYPRKGFPENYERDKIAKVALTDIEKAGSVLQIKKQ